MTLFGHDLPAAVAFGGIIVIGAVAGLVLDLIVLARLRALANRQGWKPAEIVAAGIGATPVWLLAAVGAGVALDFVSFHDRVEFYLARGAVVIGIAAATVALARIATGFVRGYTGTTEGPLPATSIFVNITRILVVVIGGLVILNALDISITPVLTALGVGGLAVALALQDTLSNLFAGLQIVASKQIRPGDFIALEGGQSGVVEDITWRYTTIRQLTNNRVVVPNAKLAAAIVTNFQLPAEELSVLVEVSVAYGSDLERVEALTKEVAAAIVEEIEPDVVDYEPIVRFHTFGDSGVHLTVVLRATEYTEQYPLKSAFIKRLHARYAEEGIAIPFPQRVVHQAQ